MKNVFYLNKNLQLAEYKCDAVAIAHYFKDKNSRNFYKMGDLRFKKIIEISFFKPIEHNLNYRQSQEAVEKYQKTHYPQYHAFLPSETIYNLRPTNKKFDSCWTRSYEDDGYPNYRYHPIFLKDEDIYLGNGDEIAQSVYFSLVLTKEEFLKINPNALLVD
jgi:hypothetical protein